MKAGESRADRRPRSGLRPVPHRSPLLRTEQPWVGRDVGFDVGISLVKARTAADRLPDLPRYPTISGRHVVGEPDFGLLAGRVLFARSDKKEPIALDPELLGGRIEGRGRADNIRGLAVEGRGMH